MLLFDEAMTTSPPPSRTARLARPGVVLGITLLVLACFLVPFFGVLTSVVLPLATHAARRQLWPKESTGASSAWSWIAWAGLWWPGVLSIFAPFDWSEGEGGGLVVSTVWLVMPLCGPVGIAAVVLPAVAVAATSLIGLLGAAATQRVYTWVAALWLAPWVHHAVYSLLGPEYIC